MYSGSCRPRSRVAGAHQSGDIARIGISRHLTHVLDEPSIGLHSRDNLRLIDISGSWGSGKHRPGGRARRRHDQGGRSHRRHGAGFANRQVQPHRLSGDNSRLMHEPRSLTSKYLRQDGDSDCPQRAPQRGAEDQAARRQRTQPEAHRRRVPLNVDRRHHGVSGSRKSASSTTSCTPRRSSTRARASGTARRRLYRARGRGTHHGRSSWSIRRRSGAARSNPVTYLKAFDRFAAVRVHQGRARGLSASHFSFNVPGSRCETCQASEVRVEIARFSPTCSFYTISATASWFQPQVLEVTTQPFNHAGAGPDRLYGLTFFSHFMKVFSACTYSTRSASATCLGQPAATLSNWRGAADHARTSRRIPASGFCILDEPTAVCTSTTSRSC